MDSLLEFIIFSILGSCLLALENFLIILGIMTFFSATSIAISAFIADPKIGSKISYFSLESTRFQWAVGLALVFVFGSLLCWGKSENTMIKAFKSFSRAVFGVAGCMSCMVFIAIPLGDWALWLGGSTAILLVLLCIMRFMYTFCLHREEGRRDKVLDRLRASHQGFKDMAAALFNEPPSEEDETEDTGSDQNTGVEMVPLVHAAAEATPNDVLASGEEHNIDVEDAVSDRNVGAQEDARGDNDQSVAGWWSWWSGAP